MWPSRLITETGSLLVRAQIIAECSPHRAGIFQPLLDRAGRGNRQILVLMPPRVCVRARACARVRECVCVCVCVCEGLALHHLPRAPHPTLTTWAFSPPGSSWQFWWLPLIPAIQSPLQISLRVTPSPF